MSMVERPHTAVLKSVADKVVSDVVAGVERTVGASHLGQLTVKAPAFAFEKYGLEIGRPALWMCNVADATFKAGDHFEVGGVTWIVVTDPQVHDADSETSHATALLKRAER